MASKIELLSDGDLTAGQVGDFVLEITVGDTAINTGGGFLIYPPITTVPHVWSMVRWQLGGCLVKAEGDGDLDAWMVLPDRFIYAESCATMVRVVNRGKALKPGYKFKVILSDSKVQTFAMRNAWFALEEDTRGVGHEAYTAPIEGVPIEKGYNDSDCYFDYEKAKDQFCYFNVRPGKATQLVAVLEAKPREDGKVYLGVRAEDEYGNNAPLEDDYLEVEGSDEGILGPGRVACEGDGPMHLWVKNAVTVTRPGSYYVTVRAPKAGLETVSSYTSTELAKPIYFGDLHGHTELSDGLGEGQAYFDHGREVSFCDFVSLTDHNRFDEVIIELTKKNNEPGRFVTLFGRERDTKHEHRNVYSMRPEVVAACGDNDLWATGDEFGDDMMFGGHHTNAATKHHWFAADFDEYDARHERFIEVVQNRGSFEREEIGGPVFDGGYGASVQSALAQGCKFGFVGGSDTHRGHPGGPSHPLGPYFYRWRRFNGITGAQMSELTREELWSAVWNKHTYCTTGTRILVDFWVNDMPMGSELGQVDKVTVRGWAAGTAELAKVEIIRDGKVCYCQEGNGERLARVEFEDEAVGKYYYLRVTQVDEHEAYSSPIWVANRDG